MELLVLANSKKLGSRCIAGIDTNTGNWVRPVSEHEHGVVNYLTCQVTVGKEKRPVEPLDVIQIPLGGRKPGIGHPEDVQLNLGEWKFLRSEKVEDAPQLLDGLIDDDDFLLCNTTGWVPEEVAKSGHVLKSLGLIRIESPEFSFDVYKKQLRASFTHHNHPYDLPVTALQPWVDEAKLSPEKFSLGTWYFTVSLGEPWNGKMFKLIAGGILADSQVDDVDDDLDDGDAAGDEALITQLSYELSIKSPQSAKELAKTLHTGKSRLNPILHGRTDLFEKVGTTPPMWSNKNG
jgi:hypothetical protein